MEQRTKVLPYIFLTKHGNVCVNIPRRAQIGMSDPLRDILQLPALIVENTGCAVTNIVETQTRQTMLFQYLMKSTGYIIRSVWFSITPYKDISRFEEKENCDTFGI